MGPSACNTHLCRHRHYGTTTADELTNNGKCSLRAAIRAANLHTAIDACPASTGNDTINLPPGTYALTIQGQEEDAALTGDLDITGQLTIQGAGAATTMVDASRLEPAPVQHGPFLVRQPGDRAFDVLPGANVTLEGVTVHGAFTAENGAGIANAGVLTISRSSVMGNVSYSTDGPYDAGGHFAGGGIANTGTLNVIQSSIRGNSAARGGGVWNAGQMRATASTIANNVAEGDCVGAGASGSLAGVLAASVAASLTRRC